VVLTTELWVPLTPVGDGAVNYATVQSRQNSWSMKFLVDDDLR
jgi:hypothetical protein